MPSIELRTRQSLALTPRLQQSVRLLQLSSLEFQQELRTALDTNPFLEYDSTDTEDVALAAATPGDDAGEMPATDAVAAASAEPESLPADTGDSDTMESEGPDDVPGDFSGDYSSRSSTRQNGDAERSDPAEWARSQPTLREQLHDSLRLYRLDDRDRAVARFIIEALDDDGYLRQSLSDLAASVDLQPELTEAELLVALRLVQSLDRPGLGARSLSECLSLQLNALSPDTPGRDVACLVVQNRIEDALRAANRLNCKSRSAAAPNLIGLRAGAQTDPKPGNCYGCTEDNYVVPDVIVKMRQPPIWVVSVNPAMQPRARIHRMYAELFAQSAGASRSPLMLAASRKHAG